jgi:hypothetical protein
MPCCIIDLFSNAYRKLGGGSGALGGETLEMGGTNGERPHARQMDFRPGSGQNFNFPQAISLIC